MPYMRDGMGRTGFTLLGIGKASVGIVHPAPITKLRKSQDNGQCFQYTTLEEEESRELCLIHAADQAERHSALMYKRSL